MPAFETILEREYIVLQERGTLRHQTQATRHHSGYSTPATLPFLGPHHAHYRRARRRNQPSTTGDVENPLPNLFLARAR